MLKLYTIREEKPSSGDLIVPSGNVQICIFHEALYQRFRAQIGAAALVQNASYHCLIRLGNRYMNSARGRAIVNRILGKDTQSSISNTEAINDMTEACRRMSEEKTGALIVIAHKNPLEDIISTGDRIDSAIHRRLIMNLFFKNSPLHDGALVIANNRIAAVRCTLPITENKNLPANYGMRHKAAIGITEESDADVVVVSEETGKISFVKAGKVTPIQNINELKLLLTESMGEQ